MENSNYIEEQSALCALLAGRLSDNCEKWAASGCCPWSNDRYGSSKTAILADIRRLRRELLLLAKEAER